MFELVAWTFGFYVCLVTADIALYTVVSFALMQPYTASRPLAVSMREFVREWIAALRSAPLLPLYFFVGRRMEPMLVRSQASSDGTPVIFVHGYMQNRVGFIGLARAFARKGIGPLYGFNYPFFLPIPSNARRLARFVEQVCEETKSPQVDLVCHSLGGLVAMEMMRGGAAFKIRRCVTIASPHAGLALPLPRFIYGAATALRGSEFIASHAKFSAPVPTLSVFSSHDNLVHPKETSQLTVRGGRDIEVEHLAHMSILFSPVVAEHAMAFLLETGPAAARVVQVDGEESDVAPLVARAG